MPSSGAGCARSAAAAVATVTKRNPYKSNIIVVKREQTKIETVAAVRAEDGEPSRVTLNLRDLYTYA